MTNPEEYLQKANLILGKNADGTDFKLTDDLELYEKFLTVMKGFTKEVIRDRWRELNLKTTNNESNQEGE